MTRTLTAVGAALAAIALVIAAPASYSAPDAATSVRHLQVKDPAGNVMTTGKVTSAWKKDADLRSADYRVNARHRGVMITFTVSDLTRLHGPTLRFLTVFTQGKKVISLYSELGQKDVYVYTGSTIRPCVGSLTTVDYARNTLTEYAPLSCLHGLRSPAVDPGVFLDAKSGAQVANEGTVPAKHLDLG